MTTDVKACVLTAHNNVGWYARGQERLINTLRHHGFVHDIVSISMRENGVEWAGKVYVNGSFVGNLRNNKYASDCPYTLKAAAWEFAHESLGYDTILWLDCSVYPVKDIEPVFDIIAQQGHYFWRSGYTVGHTCGQHALDYFGLSREEAFKVEDSSTSMMGLKLSNPDSKWFYNEWLSAAYCGMFHGSRAQIAQGTVEDKKQLFAHRQDQSCASILIYRKGLHMHDPGEISMYANDNGNYPESVRLVMRGL